MVQQYPFLEAPSALLLGANNEDGSVELLLLDELAKKSGGTLRSLAVVGGGDNFLSILAHPSTEFVKAVDMNPVQLALGQLKLELACFSLSKAEVSLYGNLRQGRRHEDESQGGL